MAKLGYAHISMVLDRSGSMESCKEATIAGINTFVAGHKATPGTATFTLVQFDDRYEAIHSATPLPLVGELTAATYVPRGSTALYDSVARCIEETGRYLGGLAESERPEKVVFAIVTDGMENASVKTTAKALNDMVRHQTDKYGWVFTYIGANQDAIMSASAIGIHSNALNFLATPAGTQKTFAAAVRATSGYRTGAVSGQSLYFGAKHVDDIPTE